jgi:hypothetical protein
VAAEEETADVATVEMSAAGNDAKELSLFPEFSLPDHSNPANRRIDKGDFVRTTGERSVHEVFLNLRYHPAHTVHPIDPLKLPQLIQ